MSCEKATMNFDQAVQYMGPMQVTDYLHKTLDFLKGDNHELYFPNISPYVEAFLVNIVTNVRNLLCDSFSDVNKRYASEILQVLEMSKYVYTWIHSYENGKIGKKVLVYKKIYMKSINKASESWVASNSITKTQLNQWNTQPASNGTRQITKRKLTPSDMRRREKRQALQTAYNARVGLEKFQSEYQDAGKDASTPTVCLQPDHTSESQNGSTCIEATVTKPHKRIRRGKGTRKTKLQALRSALIDIHTNEAKYKATNTLNDLNESNKATSTTLNNLNETQYKATTTFNYLNESNKATSTTFNDLNESNKATSTTLNDLNETNKAKVASTPTVCLQSDHPSESQNGSRCIEPQSTESKAHKRTRRGKGKRKTKLQANLSDTHSNEPKYKATTTLNDLNVPNYRTSTTFNELNETQYKATTTFNDLNESNKATSTTFNDLNESNKATSTTFNDLNGTNKAKDASTPTVCLQPDHPSEGQNGSTCIEAQCTESKPHKRTRRGGRKRKTNLQGNLSDTHSNEPKYKATTILNDLNETQYKATTTFNDPNESNTATSTTFNDLNESKATSTTLNDLNESNKATSTTLNDLNESNGATSTTFNDLNESNKATTTLNDLNETKYKISTLNNLVAVMTEPFTALTSDQVDNIKIALEARIEAMVTCESSYWPSFRGKPFYSDGVLKLQCEDEKDVEWLQNTVDSLVSPIPGTVLVVKQQTSIPKLVKSAALLPHCSEDLETIRQILIGQNRWYQISMWSFYHAKHSKSGTYLVLGIPGEQIPLILARGRRLSYKLGNAYITFFDAGGLQEMPPDH